MRLSILYRGPLSSCNYDCGYCPFAKRRDGPSVLAEDRRALQRFCHWVERQTDMGIGVLFTPWGEALIRPWYQDAFARLSRLEHVDRVVAQTNLSGRLDWLGRCCTERVALWATYHPGQTTLERFISQCTRLDDLGVRYSVGVVGLPTHREAIVALRAALPERIYLWINAYSGNDAVCREDDHAFFGAIDPLYAYSKRPHPSRGQRCLTGERVISVDGDGIVRRCHFVPEPIGRLYEQAIRTMLKRRPCPNVQCDCHIGYVHMPALGLYGVYGVYGENVLERIPMQWPHSVQEL